MKKPKSDRILLVFGEWTNGQASHSLRIVGTAPNVEVWLFKNNAKGGTAITKMSESLVGLAQSLYEGELRFNYGWERGSHKFDTQVKRVRKALGYSYP